MALDLDWLMADYHHYVRCHEHDQGAHLPHDRTWPDTFEEWLRWQDSRYLEEHSLEVDD